MELFHYHLATGNFGDDLNLWLWDEVLPGWREALPDHLLVGVGTLINDKLPLGRPKLIMGSGLGYGALPRAELMAECRFVAVRGPRSEAALRLAPGAGIVDPAVLISDLPRFRDRPKVGRPIFVPHISSMGQNDWARICTLAGIDFVSPEDEADTVIARLAQAPLVIAESMHAAILADALRTPWHAFAISAVFNEFKWLDWSESLDIPLVIHRPSWHRAAPLGDGTAHAPDTAGSVHATRPKRSPLHRLARQISGGLRQEIRIRLLARTFAQLVAAPGQLSQTERLEDRKTALRARLTGVLNETASRAAGTVDA